MMTRKFTPNAPLILKDEFRYGIAERAWRAVFIKEVVTRDRSSRIRIQRANQKQTVVEQSYRWELDRERI